MDYVKVHVFWTITCIGTWSYRSVIFAEFAGVIDRALYTLRIITCVAVKAISTAKAIIMACYTLRKTGFTSY